MPRRTVLILLLLAWSPAALVSALEPSGSTTITFEDTAVGQLPKELTTALTGGGGPVSWIVADDPTAPGGPRVLMQTSADKTSARFPLAIYEPVTASDVSLCVDFKPVSGTVDQAAGLVWRYQDSSNYYIVRANALEGNVVLYKMEGGKRSDLKPLGGGFLTYGAKVEVASGRWRTLGVVAKGKRFSVSLDGRHLFDVEDETFTRPGKVGLWTKADSVTAFDRLRISPVDMGSPP